MPTSSLRWKRSDQPELADAILVQGDLHVCRMPCRESGVAEPRVLFALLWLGREESKHVYIYHSCLLTGRLLFFFFCLAYISRHRNSLDIWCFMVFQAGY